MPTTLVNHNHLNHPSSTFLRQQQQSDQILSGLSDTAADTYTASVQQQQSSQQSRSKPSVVQSLKRSAPNVQQSLPEFIQELVKYSSRVTEGIISLRMAADVDSLNYNGTKASGDPKVIASKIVQCYELFTDFVKSYPPNFYPYLNAISFTLFVKSFIYIFDLGCRIEGKEHLKMLIIC